MSSRLDFWRVSRLLCEHSHHPRVSELEGMARAEAISHLASTEIGEHKWRRLALAEQP